MSFHNNIESVVHYDRNVSKTFLFAMMPRKALASPKTHWHLLLADSQRCVWYREKGTYLHIRTDKKLFNHSHLTTKSKTQVKYTFIRGMLFADNFAIAIHSPLHLKNFTNCFVNACTNFGADLLTSTAFIYI